MNVKKFLKYGFWIITVGIYVFMAAGVYFYVTDKEGDLTISGCKSEDNVKVIKVSGELWGYGQADDRTVTLSSDLVHGIELADKDPNIKYILLEIDSPGGEAIAGEETVAAIRHASKPTIALIKELGMSAGFWIATAARYCLCL